MARQQAYTKDELLDATELLLIERGYDGFHLKALSERLGGGRSTIYAYFSNKEELVAACMRRALDGILDRCAELDGLDPVHAIKRMLFIFLEKKDFHKLMSSTPRIESSDSEHAHADIIAMERGHEQLQAMLMHYFTKAQASGLLRPTIPLPVVVAAYYHAISIPNWMNLPDQEWFEYLFSLFWHGCGSTQN